jgi:hypothetical protein
LAVRYTLPAWSDPRVLISASPDVIRLLVDRLRARIVELLADPKPDGQGIPWRGLHCAGGEIIVHTGRFGPA